MAPVSGGSILANTSTIKMLPSSSITRLPVGGKGSEEGWGIGNQISLAGFICLSFSALTLNYIFIFKPVLYRALLLEGPVEYLAASLFGISGLLMFIIAFQTRSTGKRRLFISCGIILIVITGEELSWGQHIFGFQTPGWLENVNAQSEINFHNLTVLTEPMAWITEISAYYLWMVIIAAFYLNKNELFGIRLPSIPLALGLLLITSYRDSIELEFSNFGVIAGTLYWSTVKYLPFIAFVLYIVISKRHNYIIYIITFLALTISLEYMNHVMNNSIYIPYIDRWYKNWNLQETRELLASIVVFFYTAELLNDQNRIPLLHTCRHDSVGIFSGLFACSWVIIGGILFVPIGYYYNEYVSDTLTNRFYSKVAINEPVIRSTFDVYVTEDQVVYFRELCTRADIEPTHFSLQVFPVYKRDLPKERWQLGSNNLDFNIDNPDSKVRGVIDDSCIIFRALPDYAIRSIRTGQYDEGERVWEVEIPFTLNADRES